MKLVELFIKIFLTLLLSACFFIVFSICTFFMTLHNTPLSLMALLMIIAGLYLSITILIWIWNTNYINKKEE